MLKTKPARLTDEQLKKNEKTIKVLLAVQAVSFAILICVGIYITMKKGFGVFTVFPLTILPTAIPAIVSLTAIRKELKTRNPQ